MPVTLTGSPFRRSLKFISLFPRLIVVLSEACTVMGARTGRKPESTSMKRLAAVSSSVIVPRKVVLLISTEFQFRIQLAFTVGAVWLVSNVPLTDSISPTLTAGSAELVCGRRTNLVLVEVLIDQVNTVDPQVVVAVMVAGKAVLLTAGLTAVTFTLSSCTWPSFHILTCWRGKARALLLVFLTLLAKAGMARVAARVRIAKTVGSLNMLCCINFKVK
ncbi:MAG TPA: hypothetical protein DDW92_02975 [Candidatus Veblenbacteria bacterium]|nr:hypothetical protein [Candidatus Veblenbacteria bacterium]